MKFYPMELGVWFLSTCFFAFILSHLIADLFFHHREVLYHFTIFLLSIGMAGIYFCERQATRFHILSKKTSFEIQGRFLSFEILFILVILFAMNH